MQHTAIPSNALSGNPSTTKIITASDAKNPIEMGTMNGMNSCKLFDILAAE
jgi:hypothetical protein